MKDLAPQIHARKLTDIVIPGSHDTGTYGLDGILWDFAGTQNKSFDLTAALNHGVRQFDIRVEFYDPGNRRPDFYAVHGSVHSTRVTLSDMLTQVQHWTLAPGHEREIILLSLSIDPKSQPFPTETCKSFTDALGPAWLQPGGGWDPGQLTLDRIWALGARVIFDNAECNGGQSWPVDLFPSYYANQCHAPPYTAVAPPNLYTFPGITNMVLDAVRTRAGDGGGDNIYPGFPVQVGPPTVGGVYVLFTQATTTASCPFPLWSFDPQAELWVQAALYQQWQTDPATRAQLNVFSGDFVEETNLVAMAIAMNSTWPVVANEVIARGGPTYRGVVGHDFPPISAEVIYNSGDRAVPVDGQRVDFAVEDGPFFTDTGTSSTRAVSHDGTATVHLNAGSTPGKYTLVAWVPCDCPGGLSKASWELVVRSATDVTFEAFAGADQSGAVDTVLPTNFAVRAINADGETVPNIPVTFDASPSGGTFAGAGTTATTTTNDQGIATAPPYTTGTRAGPTSIAVESSDEVGSFSIPFTITPGPARYFIPLSGELQSTPIDTAFPQPLTGRYTDAYGNPIPNHTEQWFVDTGVATWPNGTNAVDVTSGADGIATAPVLTAGDTVPQNYDRRGTLLVYVGENPTFSAVRLRITPGPPASVTATAGNDQSTGRGEAFPNPLQATVTDAKGNPIAGTPVTFAVTGGDASFPPLDVGLLSQVTGLADLSTVPAGPRSGVTVPTDEHGVATAPKLTAGSDAGAITVQASSATVSTATQATFHLTSRAIPPSAPTITSLTNGDGQVAVAFTPGDQGTAPVTAYTVSAANVSQPGAAPVTATGTGSPVTVTGLINGDSYTFTVTATSADGTSAPSQPSAALTVGVPPTITGQPTGGRLGVPYSSAFLATGAPPPTFTLLSGGLPPGLNLHSDGTITGTPTAVGDFPITVRADNHVGIVDSSVTISIATAVTTCAGRAATIVGSARPDRLAGTRHSDVIAGGLGNDRIRAGGGGDLICAGPGNDRLAGGPGNDHLLGGSGNDRFFGGGGRDRINPGSGRDRVAAGGGNDRIRSRDSRPDVIDCGPGGDAAMVDRVDRTRRC